MYLINAFDHTQSRYDMVKLQSVNLDVRRELVCGEMLTFINK